MIAGNPISAPSARRPGLRGAMLGFLGVLAVSACPAVNAAAPLGFDDARHLLSRTSLAAAPEDIAAFGRLTRQQAVDRALGQVQRSRDIRQPPPLRVDRQQLENLEAAMEQTFDEPHRVSGDSSCDGFTLTLMERCSINVLA